MLSKLAKSKINNDKFNIININDIINKLKICFWYKNVNKTNLDTKKEKNNINKSNLDLKKLIIK